MPGKYTLQFTFRQRDQSRVDPSDTASQTKDEDARARGEEGAYVETPVLHVLDAGSEGADLHDEVARVLVGYGVDAVVDGPYIHDFARGGKIAQIAHDSDVIASAHEAYLIAQEQAAATLAKRETSKLNDARDAAKAAKAELEKARAEAQAAIAETVVEVVVPKKGRK